MRVASGGLGFGAEFGVRVYPGEMGDGVIVMVMMV